MWEQPQQAVAVPSLPDGYKWDLTVDANEVFLKLRKRLGSEGDYYWITVEVNSVNIFEFDDEWVALAANDLLSDFYIKEDIRSKVRAFNETFSGKGDMR